MVLTDEQKRVIKATAPVLKEHGKQIATLFYQKVQTTHPELRNYLNQTNQIAGTQALALAHTLYCVAEHINNLEILMPQIEQISNKHCAFLVRPEHYPIVGRALLDAIAEVLGDRATSEILESWKVAYGVLSSVFIGLEKQIFGKLGNDERNQNFADFKIFKKEKVGAGPTVAITLGRVDGGRLCCYQPGQYIAVRIEKGGLFHSRLYGLTESFNGETYTILMKQEVDTACNAIVSNEIIQHFSVGSIVSVTPPSGNFAIVNDAKHHLCISGGVGIGPIKAMIEALHAQGRSSSATVVQCVRTTDHAIFANELRSIVPEGHYKLLTGDIPMLKMALGNKLNADTHVYISGSEVFVATVDKYLVECGHPKSCIHSESIGPTLCILNRCC